MGTMLACAWLVGSVHFATTPFVNWFTVGPNEDVFALSVRRLACFSHNDLMMRPVPDAALRMCFSRPSLDAQLHLTLPSRHPSGWTPLVVQETLLLRRHMVLTSAGTWTQLMHAQPST